MERRRATALLAAAILLCAIPAGSAQDAASDATAQVAAVADDASADSAGDALGNALVDGKLDRAAVREAVARAFVAKRLTRDRMRRLLVRMYARRALTRADLRWLLVGAYKQGELTRDDVRELVLAMYREKHLTRADLRWLLVGAYREGELTRDDLRELLGAAHRAGLLTREDLRWLVVSAYRAGELERADLAELLGAMYKEGQLDRQALKWLVIEGYRAGELRLSDVRFALGRAHRLGQLARADLRWLLVEAHRAGELEAGDVQRIISESVSQGDLSKDDAQAMLAEAYRAGELNASDVDAAEVAAAARPAVEEEERPSGNDAAVVLFLAAKGKLLEMDLRAQALIAFAREKGKDVSSLVETRARFVDAVQALEDAAHEGDREAMKARGADVLKAVAAFQAEAFKVLPVRERAGIRPFTAARIAASKERLDELARAVALQVAARRLAAFDRNLRAAERLVEMAKAQGVDTSAVDAKLDAVKASRAALNEALASGDPARIAQAAREVRQKGSELARAFEREVRKALATGYLAKAEAALAKAHGFLDAADARTIDTKQERARLGLIEADVSKAREALQAGRYAASLGHLRAAHRKFESLSRSMKARALFGRGGAVLAFVGKAGQPLVRLKRAADALERRGVDISAEREQAQQVRALLDSASAKVRAEDYDGALDDAARAREGFNALRSSLLAKALAAAAAPGGG